ncbi:MAG TPA: SPFH domain-containing protein [Terricaulis sp.]|nr:SPFH domain-containing protein [Terricaulis sp.]HRP11006.1 SPFH domain-containing protein [Terricaulis sp.]
MSAAPLRNTQERVANTTNGGLMLLLTLVVLGAGAWLLIDVIAQDGGSPLQAIAIVAASLLFTALLIGFYTLQPNEAAAITLFGNYKGTDRTPGLRWVLPWYTRKKISLRVRNVTGEKLKVNDKRGNPIEIAAVVVWRVTDTASALFDVDHYQEFVDIQIETAVREIASHFSYDNAEHDEPTLRGDADQVSALLREKLQERVAVAGVVIDETKLSHLAYAPEIASAMLRRQQAEAVLAARQKIVQGAVEMVEHALNQLSERDVVKLDDERRAAMVSNLLVVLCSDNEAQPVINAGTIYQ